METKSCGLAGCLICFSIALDFKIEKPSTWSTIMHTKDHPNCHLQCPWASTQHCLLARVSDQTIRSGHLSLGQLSGVRAVYNPHPLPPCICQDGSLRFGDEMFTVEVFNAEVELQDSLKAELC